MRTFCSTSSIVEPGARDRQPIRRTQTQRAGHSQSARRGDHLGSIATDVIMFQRR
jgi:hypothetical protein